MLRLPSRDKINCELALIPAVALRSKLVHIVSRNRQMPVGLTSKVRSVDPRRNTLGAIWPLGVYMSSRPLLRGGRVNTVAESAMN
jgi:hypothetical protein